MTSFDLFRMALGNLIRRAARTLLTILGVVIGTASIVIMLSLGIAMDEGFKEQLSYMGDLTIIEIYQGGSWMMGGSSSSGGQQQEVKLDDNAVAAFKRIPNVKGVMPVTSTYMRFVAGKMVGSASVIGVDPANLEAFEFKVADGRLLNNTDKNTILVGQNIPYNFYNPRQNNYYGGWPGDGNPPPIDLMTVPLLEMTSDWSYGEPAPIGGVDPDVKAPKVYEVKTVGILAESNSDKDYNVYMHIDALNKILEEERRNQSANERPQQSGHKYESVKVKVEDFEQVQAVNDTIKSMGFSTYSLTDILESMRETSRMIQGVLGGIGAVSFFVAAIGITNTMVMSIYERTREIGIMKVIGADLSDIKRLFLIEAGMLGLVGGTFGVALSYVVSYILNSIGAGEAIGFGGSSLSIIPAYLSLAAVAFATIVGLISGYSPARRAMKLSAIDAIRTDN